MPPFMMTAHWQSLQRNNTACRDIPSPSSREPEPQQSSPGPEKCSRAGTAQGRAASPGLSLLSPCIKEAKTHRASTAPCPHAMLPTEAIIFLFHRLEHKGWGVHGLLDGRQLPVLLEVDAAVGAQQDVLPAAVVPVLGGLGQGKQQLSNSHSTPAPAQTQATVQKRVQLQKQLLFYR